MDLQIKPSDKQDIYDQGDIERIGLERNLRAGLHRANTDFLLNEAQKTIKTQAETIVSLTQKVLERDRALSTNTATILEMANIIEKFEIKLREIYKNNPGVVSSFVILPGEG